MIKFVSDRLRWRQEDASENRLSKAIDDLTERNGKNSVFAGMYGRSPWTSDAPYRLMFDLADGIAADIANDPAITASK